MTTDVLPAETFDYAIVESVTEVRFVDLRRERLEGLTGYERGLAFGEEGELRWQRRRAGRHMVYISDAGRTLPSAEDQSELEVAVNQLPEIFLLRGERQEGEFLEGRIPKPIAYPERTELANCSVLAVALRHYVLDGERIFRCVALRSGY
jgi:hypothetical protein